MYTGAAGQVMAIPAGALQDDYMVAMSQTTGTTLSLSLGSGAYPDLMLGATPYHADTTTFNWFLGKKLDAADIAAMTITTVAGMVVNYPLFVGVFRGAVSAALLDFQYSTTTSPDLVFPGQPPDANHVAMVAMMLDQSGTISTTVAGSPATWTLPYNGNPETSGYFGEYIAYSTNYSNTPNTFTPFGIAYYQTGGLIEMRSV